MGIMYIDEKGPQETIRPAKRFDDDIRLSLGHDLMRSYVADMVYIPQRSIETIDFKVQDLENTYKNEKKNNFDKELKGASILAKNFTFGIASLKERNSSFYYKLFDILLEQDAENLLFAVNKMSLAVDVRLNEWLLTLEERRLVPFVTLSKYVLVKYLENDASKSVVMAFFDKSITEKKLAYMIIEDMKNFIEEHKNIKKFHAQIKSYKDQIKILKQNISLLKDDTNYQVKFDWDKVRFSVDLWITEKKFSGSWSSEENDLVLDEGIPSIPFKNLGFRTIYENQPSDQHTGLRIADYIVVITGSLISKLTTALRYDKNHPEKRTLLSNEWFALEEHQYKLIDKISDFIFGKNMHYSIVSDTYFDDTLIFETYLRHISSFKTYEEYNNISATTHSKNYHKTTLKELRNKYEEANYNEFDNRIVFGSLRKGIKEGFKKKL